MKKNGSSKTVVAENYRKATNYLNTNGWVIYFLCGFWCIVFLVAMLVDYGLSYDFFSQLARNEFGVVPDDLIFTVKLKACLGLSIVLLLEYTFKMLSKLIQRLVFLGLFILILVALWNIGGAQIFPLLNDHVQNEYMTKDTTSDVFSEWLGKSLDNTVQTEKDVSRVDVSLDESIGKKGFIRNSKWYRSAFLFFSFMGLVAIINISKNEKKIGQLFRAKHIVSRYNLLEQSEKSMEACDNDIRCLDNNRGILYRAAKEEVLAAYTCGLRVLKTHLHNLIIYGEKHKAFSEYSFWQIHRVSGINGMNIEETKEINKAEESLGNIRLANPDMSVDNNSIEIDLSYNDPENSEFNSVKNSYLYEHALEDV